MFCKNCGKEIDEKAVICIHCGCAVEPMVEPTTSTAKVSVCAIIGFCLSLVGLFLPGWAGILCEVAALILSIIGVNEAKKGKKLKGLAIAGIAISAAGFVICIIVIIWAAYILALAGAQMATILPLIV